MEPPRGPCRVRGKTKGRFRHFPLLVDEGRGAKDFLGACLNTNVLRLKQVQGQIERLPSMLGGIRAKKQGHWAVALLACGRHRWDPPCSSPEFFFLFPSSGSGTEFRNWVLNAVGLG